SLKGTTADPSGIETVTVNGSNPQGKMNFTKSLTLSPGNNLITVMAKDTIDNVSIKQITLIYQNAAPNPTPIPEPDPEPIPEPDPVLRIGFQGVEYAFHNPFETDQVSSESKMYVLTQFLQSKQVKKAMQDASWASVDALNVDMQDESLWIKDSISGQETGVSFHKQSIKLYEDAFVKVIQRYQKMRMYDPQDTQVDGKDVLFSVRGIMQKQPFDFLDAGSVSGLLSVEIINNRFVQIMSSGNHLLKLQDGSTLSNGLMATEKFVNKDGYSYYQVTREMMDLLSLESTNSWGNTISVFSHAENNTGYVNMSNVILHMTSSIFVQKFFQGQNHYAGFLSLPGLDFESVTNYLFSLNKEKVPSLEEKESKKGYFNANKEKLKQIDKGFFNMLDLKTFVSKSTRKQKYLWAFKAISGLDSKVTQLFEDANFFISASEIVDLIEEGKYAVAFVELAAEFAGEVLASSLVTAGIGGVCSASALTGPGSIAICGGALIASPALYVSIGNTTYSFVKYAGMKSFAMFFDGFAYLFDQQKAQKLSEFIGYDWLLYQSQEQNSSQSWSKEEKMQTIDARSMDVISSFDQGNTNFAITACINHSACMKMELFDSYELQVIELALLDVRKDAASNTVFYVDFKHESGSKSRVILSLADLHSVTSYQGEMNMAQFLLKEPLILKKGMHTVEISHANGQEYQLCWLEQGNQQYHRFLGKVADNPGFGCSLSSRFNDFFTPYFFLLLIILLILARDGHKKVKIRF
ncbi:MAG: hypothetical protein Q8Q33_08275, partial [Chlamydiota bacterium]|nr:hypothetical protein [Chlamydiota bacterium]